MAKTNDNMNVRLSKQRQEKINKPVVEKLEKNESISSLNEKLDKFLEEKVTREWSHNNTSFKEVEVDYGEVEVIPGITIKYKKVENYQKTAEKPEWELRYVQWEAIKPDNNAINEAVQKHIIKKLGITNEVRIGSTSGCVPLSFTELDETYKKHFRF